MKIDVSKEIRFKTARSGGKGGQHVNKVETMVTGFFKIAHSLLLTTEQKATLLTKLSARLNAKGELFLKSQAYRTQPENKAAVIKKINAAVAGALKKEKKRIHTEKTKASVIKRLESKKRVGEQKSLRKKITPD